jgi:hypothetical protein
MARNGAPSSPCGRTPASDDTRSAGSPGGFHRPRGVFAMAWVGITNQQHKLASRISSTPYQ